MIFELGRLSPSPLIHDGSSTIERNASSPTGCSMHSPTYADTSVNSPLSIPTTSSLYTGFLKALFVRDVLTEILYIRCNPVSRRPLRSLEKKELKKFLDSFCFRLAYRQRRAMGQPWVTTEASTVEESKTVSF